MKDKTILGDENNIFNVLNSKIGDNLFSVKNEKGKYHLFANSKSKWGKKWIKIKSFFGFGPLRRVIKFISDNESIFTNLKTKHIYDDLFRNSLNILKGKVERYGAHHCWSIKSRLIKKVSEVLDMPPAPNPNHIDDHQLTKKNTLEAVLKNYDLDQGNLSGSKGNLCTLNKVIQVASDFFKRNKVEDAVELEPIEGLQVVASYNKNERRFSLVQVNDSQPLGQGSFGTVTSVLSITSGNRVAYKRLRDDIVDEYLYYGRKGLIQELKNLGRFQAHTKDHQKLMTAQGLPTLPFLPIQVILHKVSYIKTDHSSYLSNQYDIDLYEWNKFDHNFAEKFNVIYQMLYAGAFCEIIQFCNFDIKTENIFIKDGKIALADLASGAFADELNREEILTFSPIMTPVKDESILNDRSVDDLTHQKLRQKLCAYQIAFGMFEVLMNDIPHTSVMQNGVTTGWKERPQFPSEPATLTPEKIENFKSNLTPYVFKPETTSKLLKLFEDMLKEDILKRTDCTAAWKTLNKIIQNDTKLRAMFLKFPWQQDK